MHPGPATCLAAATLASKQHGLLHRGPLSAVRLVAAAAAVLSGRLAVLLPAHHAVDAGQEAEYHHTNMQCHR
jgi:hypothetical protein